VNWLAGAPFWLAAAVLAVVAWRRRPSALRPAQEWAGRWEDGDDRQRRCIGAEKVRGPVVYWHFDAAGECVYHGKAVKFARRMRQEAHERMSDSFHTWRAKSVPARDLLTVEDAGIKRLRPRFNRAGNPGRRAA
jgi:hypothetical protein